MSSQCMSFYLVLSQFRSSHPLNIPFDQKSMVEMKAGKIFKMYCEMFVKLNFSAFFILTVAEFLGWAWVLTYCVWTHKKRMCIHIWCFHLLNTYKNVCSTQGWSCIAGFDAYLVGGCVRDLLLKRAPKDFDVITTASLQQVLVHSKIISGSFPKNSDDLVPLTCFWFFTD